MSRQLDSQEQPFWQGCVSALPRALASPVQGQRQGQGAFLDFDLQLPERPWAGSQEKGGSCPAILQEY